LSFILLISAFAPPEQGSADHFSHSQTMIHPQMMKKSVRTDFSLSAG
jgi:hypothetical protein